jgi:beta-alanine--pyruvate transaminase
VITGFGRTGQAFAAQSFGVTPDVMTMAKALTNAAQPMGAVAVSERIHDAIFAAAPDDAIRVFPRLHVFRPSRGLRRRTGDARHLPGRRPVRAGRALSPYFLDAMFSLKDVPVVADIRGYGMLAAIELHSDGVAGRRGMPSRRTCSITD